MSIIVRPIEANLTHDTDLISRMDPYVKIYFGGQQYRTAVCKDGNKNPSWNDVFTFSPAGDTSIRIEVWDSDLINDDLIGEGSYNLMQVYNMPMMRSENEYIDLFYKGKSAGRILLSFELQGMNGCWGQPQMGGNFCKGDWNQGGGYNQGGYNQGFGNQPPMPMGWGGKNGGW